MGETHGLSQRGGVVMSMVRVSPRQTIGALIPENQATAIMSLEFLRMPPRYTATRRW